MVSLSHWGMFEIELPRWQPQAKSSLGNYTQQAAQNAANAFYQTYNFGKLD